MHSTVKTRAHAQDILDYLETHPERHDQTHWFLPNGDVDRNWSLRQIGESVERGDYNICGTTMCVAGASVYLIEGQEGVASALKSVDFDERAEHNLGLNFDESHCLFYDLRDNAKALDALRAIANGDQEKFNSVLDLA